MAKKLNEKQKLNITLILIGILTVITVLITIPKGPNIKIGNTVKDIKLHLGLDLKGGTHLVYQADTSNIQESDKLTAVEGVKDVIERRINAFGVSEPLVQTSKVDNNYRVIVELPGVTDTQKAIQMIGETPLLEFKEPNTNTEQILTDQQKKEMEEYNADAQKRANNILEKIKNGDKFEDLVKQYSEDEYTKENNGEMGKVYEDNIYFKDLVDEALQTKDTGVPWKVIENIEGYNIIKRISAGEDKKIEAYHILICYKGATSCDSTLSEAEAKSKIEALKNQLDIDINTDKKDLFIKLAKENSTEPNANTTGGYLGWFAEGDMIKEFNDAAFSLKDGEISDIVKTEYGYHLIYKSGEKQVKYADIERILIKKKTEADYINTNQWVNTKLSGAQLKSASVMFDNLTGVPQVNIEFNDEGKKLFADITTRNVGKQVAIFLDGQLISQPVVNEPITEGKAVITGKFTLEEAKQLAMRLNSGALPVSITLINQQTIGPTLGQDSLNKSFIAAIIGFALVAVYMLIFYRFSGFIADITLGIYVLINISLYKIIPITLTLSGIAGFILSIGMAVDANILIFERIKEELKSGQSLKNAIQIGFKRAWSSIRDGNLTTLIICFILYQFGTSSIKGFGLTLAIGVLTSMFSAITITRTFMLELADTKLEKHQKLWIK